MNPAKAIQMMLAALRPAKAHQMTLAALRLRLFLMWLAFWVAAVLCVLLAPVLRRDHFIGFESVTDLVMQLTGIWLPPLSCFVAYWFPKGPRKAAEAMVAEEGQIIGGVCLTIVYMAGIIVLLIVSLYLVNYPHDAIGNIVGPTVSSRIGDLVKYALLASPLILGPVSYLTGSQNQS